MSDFPQTKIERIRYADKTDFVSGNACFGWALTSEQLLNRFGNPLSPYEQVSEEDKEKKCSYELVFSRSIDKELAAKLNYIEVEYNNLFRQADKDTGFTGKRITGLVFLSIAALTGIISIFAILKAGTNTALVGTIIFLIHVVGAIVAVIITGIFQSRRNVKSNEYKRVRLEELKKEGTRVLNGEEIDLSKI